MHRTRRRVLYVLGALPFVVVLLSLIYMEGMAHLEHRPRTFTAAVIWTAETLTSTGYGGDHTWTHPLMVLFVAGVQFLGVSVLFLAFPLFVMPFFEERFEGRLPRSLPRKIRRYVLVYRWGPAVRELVGRLREAGRTVVVFEEDEAVARRLVARELTVVYGNLEEEDPDPDLLARAEAMVVSGSDAENGAFVLGARQSGFTGPVYAFMADPAHRAPMLAAGADAVYTPHHVLAAALASVASERISPRLQGMARLRGVLRVDELRIDPDSELVGTTLAEADVRARTGATVLARWEEGRFDPDPDPSVALRAGTILMVLGTAEALARIHEIAQPLPKEGPCLVVGYDEVGRKVAQLLRDAGEEVAVLDRTPGEGVTHVGNALDRDALVAAGAPAARAIVLALGSDSTAIFAASIARDVAPATPIAARVTRGSNVARVHRAGADFALSLGQVAGQILAQHLLADGAAEHEPKVRIVARPAPGVLVGHTLAEARLRTRTGCNLVALGRGGEIAAELTAGERLVDGDELFLAATPAALARFDELFGADA